MVQIILARRVAATASFRRQITRDEIRLPWFQILPIVNVGVSVPLVRPNQCELARLSSDAIRLDDGDHQFQHSQQYLIVSPERDARATLNGYGFLKCALDSISSIPSRARGNSMALNSAPTSTTSEIMYIHTSNAMPTPSEP